jgi:hypothetical protein
MRNLIYMLVLHHIMQNVVCQIRLFRGVDFGKIALVSLILIAFRGKAKKHIKICFLLQNSEDEHEKSLTLWAKFAETNCINTYLKMHCSRKRSMRSQSSTRPCRTGYLTE